MCGRIALNYLPVGPSRAATTAAEGLEKSGPLFEFRPGAGRLKLLLPDFANQPGWSEPATRYPEKRQCLYWGISRMACVNALPRSPQVAISPLLLMLSGIVNFRPNWR